MNPLNILLILSDDQGIDASAQYDLSADPPATPTLDALANAGIVFENVWATPACTTTRGSIATGQYGVHSGITYTPAPLSLDAEILQRHLSNDPATSETSHAVIGKWHLGGGNPPDTHPNDAGVGHFAGTVGGTIDDYMAWDLTIDGQTGESDQYHTSHLTDLAIDWVGAQTGPWFLWLAFVAPHSPFHLPPDHLHSRVLSGTAEDILNNPRAYYLAAIEAMDAEIDRLLDSMSQETLDNTVILFVGDNGAPRSVIDPAVFPKPHSKGSLYEGGVRVPLVVSGAEVTRRGVRETALISTADLFATIAELAGSDTGEIHDSQSFAELLSDPTAPRRERLYTEIESVSVTGWAIRDDRYKLIELTDGSQQLYDVVDDLAESTDLLPGDAAIEAIRAELAAAGAAIREPLDPGGGDATDITNAFLINRTANCGEYVDAYTSSVLDVFNNVPFTGSLEITVENGKCVFRTNAIPNHDFNDATGFANDVSAQDDTFEITTSPAFAATATPITLRLDNAILLNGVKVDLLAAACFGVGNGKIGCNDMAQPWRFDPMHAANGFRVDSHNAHTQPNGAYHYHGPPGALYMEADTMPSPLVGFAADGFPIFGPTIDDGFGGVRMAVSSHRLKAGSRPDGIGEPGGVYDGAFRDDYEYAPGLGDLDECNGMRVDGVYGYYITDAYPYVLSCLQGTPDPSFNK